MRLGAQTSNLVPGFPPNMWPARWLLLTVGLPLISFNNAQLCSNGLVGIEASGTCCVAQCPTCGGAGCRYLAEAVGLTSGDCCSRSIRDTGVLCELCETAPCIITSEDEMYCSNGVPGVETDGACCVTECGTCGGAGCRGRAAAVGLTSGDCCTQRISDSGVYCDDSETAPCIIGSGYKACSNGVAGVEADGACCVASCGSCGGTGCRKRAEAIGLTSENCCVGRIKASGVYCHDSETAPCILGSACDPSLVITLEWSDAFSDVDLYVTEPDGTVVSYQRPLGGVGFLERDDTAGFGPENYVILSDLDPDSSSVLGEYQAQGRVHRGPTESWNITARLLGEVVWVEAGDFATSNKTGFFNVSLSDYYPLCGGSFGASHIPT